MTYWRLVTTLIWVVLLIGWSNFFLISYSQKHMLLVIINDSFVSCIPCSFLFPLFPVVPLFPVLPLVHPCSPLFPCSPCYPLFPCSPLFPLVPLCSPCYPLFPFVLLFPLVPLVPPCSPFFFSFPLVPLSPLVPLFHPCSSCPPLFLLFPLFPLVPPCSPCSPVPLVNLQFTTLNVWRSQISVNEKNRSPLKRNLLKSRILSHKHVTEKVLHLIWWRQLVWEIRKSGQNYEKMKQMFHPNYSDFISVDLWSDRLRKSFLQCFLLHEKSLANKQLKK